MSAARRHVLPGGIAALGIGMALVCAGVRVGALFLPGVFLIGAGLLALGVAGVLATVSPAERA